MSKRSLLQDHETEVRAATIKDISSFVDLVGAATFAREVMPYVLALLQDVNLVRFVQTFDRVHSDDQLGSPFLDKLGVGSRSRNSKPCVLKLHRVLKV